MEPARDAVVRPLARKVARPCARPGCPAPASATLSFRYTSREAWLAPLVTDPAPETYDLCGPHADRTRPPHNWQLVDRRPAEQADRDGPEGFGGEGTVAVLAAALRSVPDAVEPPPALGAARPAPDVTIEDPPRADGEDDDLAAVLSALVAELDADHDASQDDGVEPQVEAGREFRREAGPDAGLLAGPQDRLPFEDEEPARGTAEDW